METQLPKNWKQVALRAACEPTRIWNPLREPRDEFWYVDVSAVSRDSLSIATPQRAKAGQAPSRARKIIQVGDTIFATVRPTLRRIAFVEKQYDDQIASTAFCIVRANKQEAVPRFLYYALQTNSFNNEVAKFQSGASYPAVNDKDVLNQIISLPPKPEQEKIAAVLWKVQRALDLEDKLAATARQLKQSAMRQLFTHGLRNEQQKVTPYGSVPKSWEVKALSEWAFVQGGATKGRVIHPEHAIDVPYLRVANVQDGCLDLAEMKSIRIRRDELDRYRLQKDDVVLTEGGDFDKLGRGFIWEGQIDPCIHQNHIFAVRVNRDLLWPRFVAYLAQSPYGKAYFLTVAHKTTNLACINTTKLRAFPVLRPDLEEQKEIAGILQTLDRKILVHERKRAALSDLFQTLLHQLMTAQIRVDRLDIDTSEVVALSPQLA